ncbi:MAG TPA: hypothetical protein VFX28_18980, partial [Methylomirabilota bacterium]|nr:hypothetical protein [Methylomirabilota bacterium]
HDPADVIAALARGAFDPRRLRRRRLYRVYRLDPGTRELRVAQAPRAAWLLLREVDGRRTVGAILRERRPPRAARPGRAARALLAAAWQAGFVQFREGGP